MLNISKESNKKGFTLAEITVAAAIFVIFATAVFSLYRMGSRMFVSGSWKFTRQKDTERFFETLKERIEQSSKICKVDPSATQQIIEGETNFISLKNQTNINISNGSTEQLAAFVVAKPDIRAIDPNKKGLILYHSLVLKKNNLTGLYDLDLYVAKTIDNNEFFTNSFNGVLGNYTGLTLSNFTDSVDIYSLGPLGPGGSHIFKLEDVASVTVSVFRGEVANANSSETTISPNNEIRPSIFGIAVEMQNPKHPQTKLIMNFKAKIDGSLNIIEPS